jgi:hypothetical protein
MAIQLEDLVYEGPYPYFTKLKKEPGIWVVLTVSGKEAYDIVDVGQSDNVRNSVMRHPHSECWQKTAISGIEFAAHYTDTLDAKERDAVVEALRLKYKPKCAGEE